MLLQLRITPDIVDATVNMEHYTGFAVVFIKQNKILCYSFQPILFCQNKNGPKMSPNREICSVHVIVLRVLVVSGRMSAQKSEAISPLLM